MPRHLTRRAICRTMAASMGGLAGCSAVIPRSADSDAPSAPTPDRIYTGGREFQITNEVLYSYTLPEPGLTLDYEVDLNSGQRADVQILIGTETGMQRVSECGLTAVTYDPRSQQATCELPPGETLWIRIKPSATDVETRGELSLEMYAAVE